MAGLTIRCTTGALDQNGNVIVEPDHKRRLNEATSLFEELRDQSLSLMLATVSGDGSPGASYSPFVRDLEGNFYIFVSRLADHTRELFDTSIASILLIEDESNTAQIFARRRISYACHVMLVEHDDPRYALMLDQMAERFGNVMSVLRALPDFVLFRLVPQSGRFVTGFGQAYELGGEHMDRLAFIGPQQVQGETSSS